MNRRGFLSILSAATAGLVYADVLPKALIVSPESIASPIVRPIVDIRLITETFRVALERAMRTAQGLGHTLVGSSFRGACIGDSYNGVTLTHARDVDFDVLADSEIALDNFEKRYIRPGVESLNGFLRAARLNVFGMLTESINVPSYVSVSQHCVVRGVLIPAKVYDLADHRMCFDVIVGRG
jgi:hypothetical protein